MEDRRPQRQFRIPPEAGVMSCRSLPSQIQAGKSDESGLQFLCALDRADALHATNAEDHAV